MLQQEDSQEVDQQKFVKENSSPANPVITQLLNKKKKKRKGLVGTYLEDEEINSRDIKQPGIENMIKDNEQGEQSEMAQRDVDSSLFRKQSLMENDLNGTRDAILLQSANASPDIFKRDRLPTGQPRSQTPSSEIFHQKRIDLDDFNMTYDLNESREQESGIFNNFNQSKLDLVIERVLPNDEEEEDIHQDKNIKKDEFIINLRRLHDLLDKDNEQNQVEQNDEQEQQLKQEIQQKQEELFSSNFNRLNKILDNQIEIIEQIDSSRKKDKTSSREELDNNIQQISESVEKIGSFNEQQKRKKQKKLIGSINDKPKKKRAALFPEQISKIEEILNDEGTTKQQEQVNIEAENNVAPKMFTSRIQKIETILKKKESFLPPSSSDDTQNKLHAQKSQEKELQLVLNRLGSVLEKDNNYYSQTQQELDKTINTDLALDANFSRSPTKKSKFIRIMEKDASQFNMSKMDLDGTINNDVSMMNFQDQYEINKNNIIKDEQSQKPELDTNISSKKSFYHLFFMDGEQNTKLFRSGFNLKSFLPLTAIGFRPPVKLENILIGKKKRFSQKYNNMCPSTNIFNSTLKLLLKIIYKYINLILIFGYIIMMMLDDTHTKLSSQILTIFFYFFAQLVLEYFVKQRTQYSLKIDQQQCIMYDNKTNCFVHVSRGSLCQGDIIKVIKNNRFPADTLLISSTSLKDTIITQDFQKTQTKIIPLELKNEYGNCSNINLQNVEGEIRNIPSTFYWDQFKNWQALVKLNNLPNFYIRILQELKFLLQSQENIAHRNTILKSEEFVYGIVILTGIYSRNNGLTYEKEVFNSPFFRYFDILIQLIRLCLFIMVISFRLGNIEQFLNISQTTYFFESYMLNLLSIILGIFPLSLFIALSMVDLIQKKLIMKCEIVEIDNDNEVKPSKASSNQDTNNTQYQIQVVQRNKSIIKKDKIEIIDAQKIQQLGDIQVTVSEIDKIFLKSVECSALAFQNIIIPAENILKNISDTEIENVKLKDKLLEILQTGILSCNQIERTDQDNAFLKMFEGNVLTVDERMEDEANLKCITIGDQSSYKTYKLLYYYSTYETQINIFESSHGSYRIFMRGQALSVLKNLKQDNFEELDYIQNLIKSPQFSQQQCYIIATKQIDMHELMQIKSAFSTNVEEINETLNKFATNLTFKCMIAFEYKFQENLKQLQKAGIRNWYLTTHKKINSSFFQSEIPTYEFFQKDRDDLIQSIDRVFEDLRLKKLEDPILKQIVKYPLPFNIESNAQTFSLLTQVEDINNKNQRQKLKRTLIKYYTLILYAKRSIIWDLTQFDKSQFVLMVKNVLNIQINFLGIGQNDLDISLIGPCYVSMYLKEKQLENYFYPDISTYVDFIVDSTKEIELLVLCYGRQHLNKTAIIAKSIIERNFIYIFIELLYRLYAGFSTQNFFGYKYYLLLEIFFSFGNAIYIMFNFDLSLIEQFKYPICYLQSQFAQFNSIKQIIISFARSLYQATIILFIVTETIKEPIDKSGKVYSHKLVSLTAFICFYNYKKVKALIQVGQISFSVSILILDYLIFIGFLYAFSSQDASDNLGSNSVGEMINFTQSLICIKLSIFIPIICAFPDIVIAVKEAIYTDSPIQQLARSKIEKQNKIKEHKRKTKVALDPTNLQKERYKNIDKNKKIVIINNDNKNNKLKN